jgi:hypothetical protein
MKKSFKYIGILFLLSISGCSDIIDLNSTSNITAENYYTNYSELQAGLTSCYKGLQKPLTEEWSLTELRSDNAFSDTGSSTSTVNNDFQYLDQFFPSTSHQGLYRYWLYTYNNIRNTNVVLNAVGAKYNPLTGVIEYSPIEPSIASEDQCKSIAAEASFIRAYHYFNLVRLYATEAIPNGGVFLVDKVLSPEDAKKINRSSLDDIYKFIIADLKNAMDNGNKASYSSIIANTPDQLGHANSWAAKALLAKVYLTRCQGADKVEAAKLLTEIINPSSGYNLLPNYNDVFSVSNEMNKEILFGIRFKGGGLGMGNPLPNLFAPSNSGNSVINGDGKGYNTPTLDFLNLFCGPTTTITDLRRSATIGEYAKFTGVTSVTSVKNILTLESLVGIKKGQFISGKGIEYGDFKVSSIDPDLTKKQITISSTTSKDLGKKSYVTLPAGTTLSFYTSVYPKKYTSYTALAFDAENDVPIIRYSDVLLMLAEAKGNTPESWELIDLVHYRANNTIVNRGSKSTDEFERALSLERRLEFAFENQRWFDLLRYNKTFETPANKGLSVMIAHFSNMQMQNIYEGFVTIPIRLTGLIENVTKRSVLPIPQYEIDTNSNFAIGQNPFY